jgi:hypothetical protein
MPRRVRVGFSTKPLGSNLKEDQSPVALKCEETRVLIFTKRYWQRIVSLPIAVVPNCEVEQAVEQLETYFLAPKKSSTRKYFLYRCDINKDIVSLCMYGVAVIT